MPTASPPVRARSLLLLATLGLPALALALFTGGLASFQGPGSLVFSAVALGLTLLARAPFAGDLGHRATAIAAAASLGCAPFLAFCCDLALDVPTHDSRPREGTGDVFILLVKLFLLGAGPLVGFLLALPLAYVASRTAGAVTRAAAAVAVVAAAALVIPASLRCARQPDPDGYFPSLPVVAQVTGDACPAARCVRCPAETGRRPFSLLTASGAREIGHVEAACDRLEFRYDAARRAVLVRGEDHEVRDRQSRPEVHVFPEPGGAGGEWSRGELRDGLAPPRPWVLEAALGLAVALAAWRASGRAARRAVSEADAAAATAYAVIALAAAVLFSTPLATAWYAWLAPFN
jgi:hypothetical protein